LSLLGVDDALNILGEHFGLRNAVVGFGHGIAVEGLVHAFCQTIKIIITVFYRISITI